MFLKEGKQNLIHLCNQSVNDLKMMLEESSKERTWMTSVVRLGGISLSHPVGGKGGKRESELHSNYLVTSAMGCG